MRVCVGLLPINSTTCDSVCLGSDQVCELQIYQEATNELHINSLINLERFSFQLGTIHLVVLKTVLPTLSRCY